VPDIVTLGKPIGNGHPIGAVVTRRELAQQFQASSGFFSTTGGNPVSCAAATAVLDVIEGESLQENARQVGAELRAALEDLSKRHALVGDVRGPGLFIGVELVRDRSTLEPATQEAHLVVNRLRERGVLVGLEGPHGNVIKIRPPIVFASSHVERLVGTLDAVLASIA
jgi:4-aminobutyrate aminotransferase-like enzyme